MSEAEIPKTGSGKPEHHEIDAYLRAVHGPDSGPGVAGEPLSVPVLPIGAREGQVVGVVDQESINKKIESVRSLQGFERLTLFRTLFDERMRLAQSVRGRPKQEKQFFELRIVAKKSHLELALHNEQRLQQFKAIQGSMTKNGIDVPVPADLQKNMDDHLHESAVTMNGLVALGNYIMLMYKLKDGKQIPPADLDEALRRLPREIHGRTGGTGQEKKPVDLRLDPEALAKRSWQEVLSDQHYNDCQAALDQQLEWLLSFGKDVPGVSPGHAGENPVDVFCLEYLNRSVQATLDKEINLGLDLKKGTTRDVQVQQVRDVRSYIFTEREQFKRLSGETIIRFLEDTNTGFFNKKYGTTTGIEPASGQEFGRMMSKLPEQRAMIDEFFEGSSRTFDAHRALVDRVFSFSIFNLKDWKYYGEDLHKKQFLSKVYPLIDTMVRVRAAPKVLSSQAAAAALRKFEKETGIPTSYVTPIVETTFKEEADKVMREIQEGWHLPKTVKIDGKEVPFDFHNDAHWAAINPEQWAEIQKSQESTMSICERQRGEVLGKLDQCISSVQLLKTLRGIQHPLELLETDPDEQTFRDLLSKKVSPEALLKDPELKSKKQVLVALYFYALVELDGNWDAYLAISGQTDTQLKEVAERSLDEGRGYGNAKDKVPVPWWLVVWYASAMARAKWKAPWKPPFFRAPWRMVRDIPWAGRTALSPTGLTQRPPVRDLVDWAKKKPPKPTPVPPEKIPPKQPTVPAAQPPPKVAAPEPIRPPVPPEAPPPRPVASAPEPAPVPKLPAAAETKAAETALKRVQSRFLGHAGFILFEVATVSEILQSLERTANAELMNEYETLDAVAELWRDAARGVKLEQSGDQFWMAGYNRKYYEALGVIGATGRREWVTQEREIIRQLQLTLDMVLILRSGTVPTEIPVLPARTARNWPEEFWKKMEAEREVLQKEGDALTERHGVLLKSAKDLHATRAAQFPVYQLGSPLVEQPFTRDRASGKININTSGTSLGFIPVKFNNGPIQKFRQAGLSQRETDEFKYDQAQEAMKEFQKAIELFQSDVRRYLDRGWKFERSLHYGPNAPEEPKPDLQGWLRSLDK